MLIDRLTIVTYQRCKGPMWRWKALFRCVPWLSVACGTATEVDVFEWLDWQWLAWVQKCIAMHCTYWNSFVSWRRVQITTTIPPFIIVSMQPSMNPSRFKFKYEKFSCRHLEFNGVNVEADGRYCLYHLELCGALYLHVYLPWFWELDFRCGAQQWALWQHVFNSSVLKLMRFVQ